MALQQQAHAFAAKYNKDAVLDYEKYKPLRDLDIFVLDNSLRETTVAQLRSHTLEAKLEIYNNSKKMGFKDIIVASFNHESRVGDAFVQQLIDAKEDVETLWAFSEIKQGDSWDTIPAGIAKLKKFGLKNVIFEMDLGDAIYDFTKISVEDIFRQTKKWIDWCRENLWQGTTPGRVFTSIRDPADFMSTHAHRAFELIALFGSMDPRERPIGMMFEEGGKYHHEDIGRWSRYYRQVMTSVNWPGHLLIHVHEKYGLCDVTALEALRSGCDGIWAGICTEGASMGHAASSVTLMNLVHLGNKKVLEKYNCKFIRKAAIRCTELTTGRPPHYKQPIYGTRAVDYVFSLHDEGMDTLDLAEFFDTPRVIRITSLASLAMYQAKLIEVFGENPDFTLDRCEKMKSVVFDDLKSNRKEEYMSPVGLAILYDRAGGKMTANMRDIITTAETKDLHAKGLIQEVRIIWDHWDTLDKVQGDDMLQFDSFYNGFMAPYFGCYRCQDTIAALKALDMDCDGHVDWNEFKVYLKWAMRQYPGIKDTDELLEKAFLLGIIPAMRDELNEQKRKKQST